ncbi:hypothetical protein K493DRAFT_339273 [Basidiobolus meristosporus CBS 931.73]|uniref:Citrate transporter-like domain-containing protein n=1 Tax=Basidiobolus meristosporus CBS 931.73 TaxID=1314790 RepID=A0A1Y1Y0S9_9FUNG|nr:hypothetical protein K493DRAFT_339273 [Basidiobolus meristosporus CBS 931.73]|eukprot:ORX91578.1 hypothetical protein K493DRAFT_339273 [Basidiobolus meristosporus CBS 931.73]
MFILYRLEQEGFKKIVRRFLLCGPHSPTFFLFKVSLTSGLMGALFLNDGAVTILSDLVFIICNDHGLHLHPFGLAVATSANIGSVATIIGCPLSMIVYESYKMFSFTQYVAIMGIPAIMGITLNSLFLCWFYYNRMEISGIPQVYQAVNYNSVIADYVRISQGIEPEDREERLVIPVIQSKLYGTTASTSVMSYDSHESQEYQDSQASRTSDEGESSPIAITSSNESDPIPMYCSNFSTSPESISPIRLCPDTPPTTPQIIMDDYDTRSTRFVWPPPEVPPNGDALSGDNASSQSSVQVTSQTLQLPTPCSGGRPAVPKLLIPSPQPLEGPSIFCGSSASSVSSHSNRSPRSPRSYGRTRATLYEKAFEEISRLWKSHSSKLVLSAILITMYAAMIMNFNPGWTCLTAAVLLVIAHGDDGSANFHQVVNWSFLCYLCGVFVLSSGLLATPIPRDAWESIRPWLFMNNWGVHLTMWAFCIILIIPTVVLGAYPTLLLTLPFLQIESDPALSLKLSLVLLWCVALYGNLTPYSSIASAIVTDICRQYYIDRTLDPRDGIVEIERSKRWFGRLQIWIQYTSWSTFCIMMLGVPVILHNIDSL